tara:strand:- start:8737 stop:9750 length:1014 start_codon:yes stop_codon:yes gene_type:complete
VRYIIKNSSSPNKSKDELLFSITKITLLLSFFLLSLFNCSKKEIISETITETIFVTKKDAFLYGDLLEKNIIDEIPAFIKIKTKEKTILKSKSNNDKIYYKTKFNGNQGWVESIYLANIKNNVQSIENKKITTKLSERKKTTPVKPKLDRKPFTNKYNNKNNDGKYFVQIASFKNKINAKKLIDKIKSSGITSYLEKINTVNGNFFRVKTNAYENKNIAINILASLKTKHPSLRPIIKPLIKQDKAITEQKINNKDGKTEYYTIQISSLKDKNSAEKLAKKMTTSGYPSKVSEAWINGKTWFRVQHGEYKMISVAKQISNKIKNEFKFDPWISNIYK